MDQITDFSNIPSFVKAKLNKNLHNKLGHPLCIIKSMVYEYFKTLKQYNFEMYDDFSPVTDVKQNFDLLRIPKDHPSRSKSDTYYVNESTVLRTHTSAHQNELLAKGVRNFLVTGDVYRKDEINRTHFYAFHQMEGVCQIEEGKDPLEKLKDILGGLIEYLFPKCKYRFKYDYFPFTEPSLEAEVMYNGKWLEILGCGVVHKEILEYHNIKENLVAWGLGLERLAMILMEIPDIRIFWSDEPKFLDQYKDGKMVKFQEFSKLDSLWKDISFWLDKTEIKDIKGQQEFTWSMGNNFYDLVHSIFSDDVESVEITSRYHDEKKDRYSHTFRLVFSPNSAMNNPAVFSKLVNEKMSLLREKVGEGNSGLNVILR